MADPFNSELERSSGAGELGNTSGSLPSRDGNAGHTLVEGHLVEMAAFLNDKAPACMSSALTLLKENFPDTTTDLRNQACTLFLERL
jgi:hypothetical protein